MKGLRSRFLSLLAMLLSAATVSAEGVQIQYSEPLQGIRFSSATGVELEKVSTGIRERSLGFNAFSQRFEMRLQPNYALLSEEQRRGIDSNLEVYRGTLAGVEGSWVRLVVANDVPRGMFWNGREMFAIEVSEKAEPFIYRLADVHIPAGTLSCGHVGSATTAGQLFAAVSAEVSSALARGPGATQQMDIAVVADFEFTSDKGAGAEAAMVARLNNVDGIFSSQVTVQLNVNQIDTFTDINDPFTDETDASLLIDELSDFRFARASQTANGLTHLFTGRDLLSSTVGIAFGSAICSSRFGAGLTQGTHSETMDSLIAAHEIGHNFGAPHDGQLGSPCESEPETFLMAPTLNGSDEFSSCSITQMQPVIAAANCITPLASTDVAVIAVGQPPAILEGSSETLNFSVNSVGTGSADNVTFDVTVPALVTLDSISASSGTCTTGAGNASCAIGTIASGSGVSIALDVTASTTGNANFDATVGATVDANANNNQATIALVIDPAVDMAVTAASISQISLNASATLNQTIENLSDGAASNAELTITPGAGVQIDSASWPLGNCTISAAATICQAPTVAAQSSSTVALRVTGMSEGNLSYTLSISADQGDPQAGNDSATGRITVGVPPPPPSEDSGGAGSVSWFALFLLALSQLRLGRRCARGRSAKA